MAENSGPEKYAPPDRRPPETPSDKNQAAANAVEGEIRQFVRRDLSFLRRQRSEPETTQNQAAENLNGVVRRVAGSSIDEIDRVIRDLENVRDMLRDEGDRITREIANYASLNHAATTAMGVIADSIRQWKGAADKSVKE
jgi:hypothetical protein